MWYFALAPTEFLQLEERARGQELDGAAVTVEQVPQTDSVTVRSRGTALSQELLELYFESRRSGGGCVQAVRVLPGGRAAIVSFQDRDAVERVLHKSHQLQEGELDVSPYYDFLEPLAEDTETTPGEAAAAGETRVSVGDAARLQLLAASPALQELRDAFPDLGLRLEGDGAWVSGGTAAQQQELQDRLLQTLQGMAQEHVPLPPETLRFLQRDDVQEQLRQRLESRRLAACYAPAEGTVVVTALSSAVAQDAAQLLSKALSPFCLPVSERHLAALSSPCWDRLRAVLPCCDVQLAPDGGHLQVVTLRSLEQGTRERLLAFLEDATPDEALVPMEPGALRFLQLHYQDLLGSIAEVTLLPLDDTDVTGFRVSGEASACCAAVEFLQSLLGTVSSQTVTLRYPGVARFLLDEPGQSLLQELESCFQCVFGLEHVRWSPPNSSHELELSEELVPLSCHPDPLISAEPLEPPDGATRDHQGSSIEEIKGLLAALQPGDGAAHAEGETQYLAGGNPEPPAEGEEDLYTAPEPVAATEPEPELELEEGEPRGPADGGEKLPGAELGSSADEEAQLLLAIQQSMDSQHEEEEQLQRATELSLRSYCRESEPGAVGLAAALEASLEEALEVADAARVTVYTAYEQDVSALLSQLEQALEAQLREEVVSSEQLRALPAPCRGYLVQLQCRHAVRLSLAGATATLHGFAEYPVAASRDLARLLHRLLPAERPQDGAGARWLHWDTPDTPVPYTAEASALLEEAWRRRQRQLDVLFDGRPFTVDFERMEEYDIGSARARPIARDLPSGKLPSSPPAAGGVPLDEEVRLVHLAEGSEEFRDTVRSFYDTLDNFHNKIRVIKVEKLIHPLLYQQYQLKKACMEKACHHRPVERLLYHGTTEESSREICQHGFNRSFCGKNATRFGQGVYFAVKAVLSVQEMYSPPSADGNKYIFVVKALTGEFTVGTPDMRVPPLREGPGMPRRYDSVVDNRSQPALFVIFNDTQAYPQYLITCQRCQAPAPV
ncbi:poly [ADP-ribose] polymerase 10 [Alligator mississippiensis]|uniref:Poly [ADP-ribose] polymerase n=1 Tax=Alligator mississippiensis TaxID=8496 RepID=A0A151N4Y8_ALLMI|nr:poly [ADP-ribose] polymerase 10 [Alligator mississippiensis]